MRILFIAAAVAAAGAAYAQSTPTTITGLVRDTSGAVIPGANVRVVSEESGVAVGATTNSAGLYRTPGVPPGQYKTRLFFADKSKRPPIILKARPEFGKTVYDLTSSKILDLEMEP